MKIYTRKTLSKQKGFTAIELLFALGIIAVATVVIVKAMSSNSDKAKAQQMIQDVSALVDNIKGAYSSSTDGYTGLDTASVIAGKLYPSDLNISGTNLDSQFSGGSIVIASSDASSFGITYNNVPSAVCSEVVSKLADETFSDISVNGTSMYSTGAGGGKVDPTAISNACGTAGAGGGLPSIVFTVTN